MNVAAVVPADERRPAWAWVLRRIRSGRARDLAAWTATAAFVALWFVLLRPGYLGGTTSYLIVSGESMAGTYSPGDLVIARPGDYEVGDVVVYRVPDSDPAFAGRRVVHRIVGGSAEEGYVTQGDATPGPDYWRPTAADVLGRVWLRVPRVGQVVLLTRALLPALAAAIAVMVVVHRMTSAVPRGSRDESGGELDVPPPPVPSPREQLPGPRPYTDRARGRRPRPRPAPGEDVAAARRPLLLRLAAPRPHRG